MIAVCYKMGDGEGAVVCFRLYYLYVSLRKCLGDAIIICKSVGYVYNGYITSHCHYLVEIARTY